MVLSIGTNNSAAFAADSAYLSNRNMEASMERLSTGKRINSASDDAAGVAIASRLSSVIRGTDQSIRNSMDARSLIDTAEGAHKEIENILQRMREVAVQAVNDTNNALDRSNLQAEMDALFTEIDRIAGTTTWAGSKLINDSNGKDFSFQVGAAAGGQNKINVSISSMNTGGLLLGSGPEGVTGVAPVTAVPAKNAYTLTKAAFSFTGAASIGTVGGVDIIGTETTDYTITLFDADGTLGTLDVTGSDSNTQKAAAIQNAFSAFGVAAEAGGFGVELSYSQVAATDEVVGVEEVIEVQANINYISVEATTGQDNAAGNALAGIRLIDAALERVNVQRSELGAISNGLNHTVNNLTNMSTSLTAAKGEIEDADFALETMELAKNQILQRASTAMLAQANASKQNVLGLLRS
jgi:flagellin